MIKVIIRTQLTVKFHLMPLFLALSSIINHLLIITIVLGFIIIFPTLMIIITSFLLILA
jgi:hypothetical protein